jgi:hypothetical protein
MSKHSATILPASFIRAIARGRFNGININQSFPKVMTVVHCNLSFDKKPFCVNPSFLHDGPGSGLKIFG